MTDSALDALGPHLLGRTPTVRDATNWRLTDHIDPAEVAAVADGRWADLPALAPDEPASLLGVVEPVDGDAAGDDLSAALAAVREHDRDPFAAWARGPFLRWARIVTDRLEQLPAPTPGPTPTPTPDPAPPAPPAAVVWPNTETTDQGQTGHCCGFGGINAMNTLGTDNVDDHYADADGHTLYRECKVLDGEPGAENGSTVHTVARALRARGRIDAYAWAQSLDEVKAWVLGHGPLIVGTEWYDGMFTPDADGLVHLTGQVAGGHCWIVRGYDPTTDRFLAQNSWGPTWGVAGCFLVSGADLGSLAFTNGGEALAALELGPAA